VRGIFGFSAENVETVDCAADDAVRFEPLSQRKFPDTGKNTENFIKWEGIDSLNNRLLSRVFE
jgi:hypothetical protein